MKTNAKQTLQSRTGETLRAVVTYHEHAWAYGRTQCGIALNVMRAAKFPTHQTAIAADLSDVNCPDCKR